MDEAKTFVFVIVVNSCVELPKLEKFSESIILE